MSGTKKRNKRYVPRAASIPKLLAVQMTTDAHPELALRLHMGIVGLIERPTIEACNKLSYELCCIVGGMSHANHGAPILDRRDAASVAIKSAIMTIEGIVDCHDRTGAVAVTEQEAKTLRAAAGKLDVALGCIPLPAYNRAVREVGALEGRI